MVHFKLANVLLCEFYSNEKEPDCSPPKEREHYMHMKTAPHILGSPDLQSPALATPNRSPPAPSGLRVVAPRCSTLEVNSLAHPLTAQSPEGTGPRSHAARQGVLTEGQEGQQEGRTGEGT